jgi:hypothetical protein
MYVLNVKPAAAMPKTAPPTTPMKSAQIVRHGIISSMASSFGATRNRTGSSAIVSSASISSFTFMVPSSAAKEEPLRPMTRIAVISGPSSRETEIATASATNCIAPNFLSSYADCRARIVPIKKVISERIGKDPIPTAMAWCTARP